MVNFLEDNVNVFVFERSKQFWTTSTDIADKFGKQHKNIIKTIHKLILSMPKDRLFFKPIFYIDSYGREQKGYEITRDGFSLLVMGFTGQKALTWKLKYIEAFNLLERELHRRADPNWQQIRQQGKVVRLQATDAIQELVIYAKNQGSKNADKYYILITNLEYKALFYIANVSPKPESLRDKLTELQLTNLATAEGIISQVIRDNIKKGIHYKKIYKLCKKKIEDFVELVGKSSIPEASSNLGHNLGPALENDTGDKKENEVLQHPAPKK